MKVLFVTSMYPSSAYPRRGLVVMRLKGVLERLGHEVLVEPLAGPGRALRYLFRRGQIADAIRTFGPDIIHVHFGYSGLAVPKVGLPVVTSFNGDDLNGTTARWGGMTVKSAVGILVSQYVAWRSDYCTTVSESLRQRLWLASCRKKTTVIRDAVDPRVFHPLDRSVARQRVGVGSEELVVLFPHDARQLNKRLPLARSAVEQLRQWEPAARLLVVNDCPPDDMIWYYAAADVMVITSVREGGPSCAKEALACGVPVVSVDVGDRDLFSEVPEAVTSAPARAYDLALALRQAVRPAGTERKSYLPPWLELDSTARAYLQVYRRAQVNVHAGSSRR